MVTTIGIPVNTTALIYIPSNKNTTIKEGHKALADVNGLEILERQKEYTVVSVGLGSYDFQVQY